MAKEPQELKWIESLLPEGEYRRKAMFGGFIYYIEDKAVLLIFESEGGSRTYKGKKYDFDLWNGCMFPVDKEFQEQALQRCPFLIPHPILPKWLYLPVHTEHFDELATEALKQAVRPNSYWGSIPKSKLKAKKDPFRGISDKMDTTRPRMFTDEPAETVLKRAKKISDLKNLGAESEKHFHKAGIKTPQQFIKLGWKKTLLKLIAMNPKHRHSIYAYALIGALTNTEFNLISQAEKDEARSFVQGLAKKEKELKKKALAKKAPQKVKKRKQRERNKLF
ncbi:TfoX/Sxy family DNA transformation protein [Bdellovibrio bacteriovorus]|uniref:TfoX/Sxy family DNA transformation protein n=1 Tax=Bdellovibrio bacteriovorus TaxID=959 RepID=UPI0035A59296